MSIIDPLKRIERLRKSRPKREKDIDSGERVLQGNTKPKNSLC